MWVGILEKSTKMISTTLISRRKSRFLPFLTKHFLGVYKTSLKLTSKRTWTWMLGIRSGFFLGRFGVHIFRGELAVHLRTWKVSARDSGSSRFLKSERVFVVKCMDWDVGNKKPCWCLAHGMVSLFRLGLHPPKFNITNGFFAGAMFDIWGCPLF